MAALDAWLTVSAAGTIGRHAAIRGCSCGAILTTMSSPLDMENAMVALTMVYRCGDLALSYVPPRIVGHRL
jgi:hypothetical protein